MTRPQLGTFGRTELAILGTPCGNIKKLAYSLTAALHDSYRIAYVDADHKGEETPEHVPALAAGATLVFTDKISFQRFDSVLPLNDFQQKRFFNDYDLILVNGNHFGAKTQIVVVDPAKSLEKKLDRLTNIGLVILKDTDAIPDYLQNQILASVPVLQYEDTEKIIDWVRQYGQAQIPPLYGLVLTGGKSTRMGRDKSQLDYHGKPQREHVYELLTPFCEEIYLSVNAAQALELGGSSFQLVEDSFLGLGPLGGILSAFRQQPDAAWLVVACDLPLLTEKSLKTLVEGRNPSKTATAFYDGDHRFPEPLVSIWEPRAYPTMLQFLAMGYSCPRKVLINSEIELLESPDTREFMNVNDPVAKAALENQPK